jgi:parvulin-like peptidyl-prolyl isomerase
MRRLLAGFLLALVWPASRAQVVPIERVLAMVGERAIMSSEVMGLVAGAEMALRKQHSGEEAERRVRELYEKGLSAAIERALILKHFEESKGQVPELLVTERVQEIVDRRFSGDRTGFLNALAEERRTLEDLQREIREEITVSLLRRQEVSERVSVSPARVQAVYAERRPSYETPEKIRLNLLSVKREGRDDAEFARRVAEVQAELAAGKPFVEVARAYSDFAAEKGGDLGLLERANLRADFLTALAGRTAGAVVGPLAGEQETSFLQVVEVQPARVRSLEEVQPELERELRRQAEEELYQAWMARLRQKYPVILYPTGE